MVRRCQAHRQDNAPGSGPPDRRPQAHWHASAAALAAWARIQRPTCAPGPAQNPSLPALRPLSVATSPRAKSASKLTGSHCRPDPGHSLRLVSCRWSCFRVCGADFRARRPGHPPGPAGSGPMSPPQAAGPHAHPGAAGGGCLFALLVKDLVLRAYSNVGALPRFPLRRRLSSTQSILCETITRCSAAYDRPGQATSRRGVASYLVTIPLTWQPPATSAALLGYSVAVVGLAPSNRLHRQRCQSNCARRLV